MILCKIACAIAKPFKVALDFLAPLADLILRIFVAEIFFMSGLVKLQSWETTVMLFEHEYHVPFLAADMAAYAGTAVEIVMPILLVLGLFGRLPAFILFIFNAVAVIAYPFLHTPEGAVGLYNHLTWGMLLLALTFHGPGKLALDNWIRSKCCCPVKKAKEEA